MMPGVMAIPTRLRAGLTNTWTETSPDYYDGFSLSYRFFNRDNAFTISGGVISQSGSEYTIDVPAASATWQAGTYRFHATVTDGTDTYLVREGTVEVLPDISSSSSFDGRSHAEKVRDALRAVVEGRATTDQLSVSINGKSIERMPFDELIKLESRYSQIVEQERRAERLAGSGQYSGIKKVGVRFDGPV